MMYRLAVLVALVSAPVCLMAGSGLSSAPGDSSCGACHGASPNLLPSQTGGNGVFMTFSGGSTYTPGVTQDVTVSIIDTAFPAFGYQTSPRIQGQDATQGGGTLIPVDADAQYYPPTGSSTLSWIGAGESATGSSTNVFHFQWTPPASGTVVFYIDGMGGNGTGGPEPNEHVYKNAYTITLAPAVVKPQFSATGVVSAAAKVPGLTPGAWLSIYGQNLSATTRQWGPADFTGNSLPTSLDGVTVSIDNKPAAVYYISPTQLDVQVPDDAAQGPVQVVVSNSTAASAAVQVSMASVAPSFFTFGNQYVAALHADNSPIGESAPAKPGEIVVLYGTGFGPTSPSTPAGVIVTTAHPLDPQSVLSISIGGVPASIAFAGITGAGLYQFNLTVPSSLSDGDAPVTATINGAATQTGVFLAVHQ